MRIAVTGARGFIGSAVARAATDAGWETHALGRADWDITSGPMRRPPEVDVVVHAAASVTDWGPGAPIWRSNVDGTRHVAATFPRARIVHISSASVYDPFTPSVRVREDAAPVRRYLTAYAASKAAAELVLADRPDTVVLRPHAVYGPGDRTLLPRVLSAVRGGVLPIVGDGRALQSLTSIGNLVAATLLACDGPPGVYNVADANPVPLADALLALLDERGVRARLLRIPARPAWAVAGWIEPWWLAAGIARPPRLNRYVISHLSMERTLDLTAAVTRLGFAPSPTSFDGAASW